LIDLFLGGAPKIEGIIKEWRCKKP